MKKCIAYKIEAIVVEFVDNDEDQMCDATDISELTLEALSSVGRDVRMLTVHKLDDFYCAAHNEDRNTVRYTLKEKSKKEA